MFTREQISAQLKYEGGISRRWFMAYAGALASIPLLGRSTQVNAAPRFNANPFSLGVASGEPDSKSVVLWTRLAPEPLDPNGGMPNEAVEVQWEIDSRCWATNRKSGCIANWSLRRRRGMYWPSRS
jgi:alkaline phosphatase D